MADYGFATTNLLSTSTSTFQVNFSSPQSGVIAISTSPFNLGSGGSFTFPSGATYYYFNNQQSWCVNVDLSKYYVLVIIYNPSSVPIDLEIQVDGSTLTISSYGTLGSAGATSNLTLSNGLQLEAITCCGFDNPTTGSSTIPLGQANTCNGASCSGCPTSGGSSSLVCSSSTTTTSGTGNVQNEPVYIFQLPQPSSLVTTESFYISPVTVPQSIISTEAFFIQPTTVTISIVTTEAFFITQLHQVVVHVYIPEFLKFISIPQAIYNVIQLNVSTSAQITQAPSYVIGVSISPTVSVSVSQATVTTPQTYEEQVFEGFMALPVLYFVGKFIIRRIRRLRKKRGENQ